MGRLNPGFRTTRWSLVVAAGRGGSPDSRAALSELCETYWYPLYAYARRRGLAREEAEDRTQSFFAALLEKDWVGRADSDRGRFRAFLLTAFKRHVSHEREKDRALRRGGGRPPLRLDFDDGERRYSLEPAHTETPERLFDRRWALTLLARTLDTLGAEMAEAGRGPLFEELRVFLPGAGMPAPHAEIAARLGLTPGAVKVAVHRMRARYRDRLRAEIAQTVDGPEAIDAEIRDLLTAI